MKYHLAALFTIFVWGMTFVSTKVLLVDFTPLQILFIRFVIGFLALCTLRPHILKLAERRHEWLFVAAGATGIAAYYLLENIALVFSTATAVGIIVSASPLITALIQAARGDRTALNMRFFLGFIFAMGGLIIVGTGSEQALEETARSDALSIIGYALTFLAAFVWAIYPLLVKRIADLGYETIAATKRTFLWGLVFIVPATFAFGGAFPGLETFIEPTNLINLLFLGGIASAACFVTWGVSVKHLGPIISTTYIYLVPAITATASIIILGEPLTLPIVLGVTLTIAGLILSQSRQRRDSDRTQQTARTDSTFQ